MVDHLQQNDVFSKGRSVILVNAQHMKAIPGRKTDMKDSEWLADLLRHGLLKASFIPPAPIRELRDLSRYRKSLVQVPAAAPHSTLAEHLSLTFLRPGRSGKTGAS